MGAESINLLQATRGYEPMRDLLTNLTTVALPGTAPAPVSRFDYANDALGRRTRRVDTTAAVTTNAFEYNSRSELTNAIMGANAFAYQYDPIGNRQWAANPVETLVYTANGLNQYTSISDGGVQVINYDPDGNCTNDGNFAYSWDCENRLVAASSESTVASYAYDYMSRRIRKIVGSTTNTFIYDGWNLISEICNTESEITTNYYIWGSDLSGTLQDAGGVGGLLSVTRVTSSGTATYFPCYDANGNITDYIDANGTVVAHREYDAFGQTTAYWTSLSASGGFHFWFSTKYLDQETGLYYYGYRYYDPITGRWLSRDSLEEEGGLLLYGFVHNDPVNYVDPDGEIPLDTIWDIGNIIYDIAVGDDLSLAADVAALFVPYVPAGATKLVRAAKVAEVAGICNNAKKLTVSYEYVHRARHFVKGKNVKNYWKMTANRQPSLWKPGTSDAQVKQYIERALQAAQKQGKIKPQDLKGFVHDLGKGVEVGASNGSKTSKIKLQVDLNGTIHAHPVD